jgi:hypothetical protein
MHIRWYISSSSKKACHNQSCIWEGAALLTNNQARSSLRSRWRTAARPRRAPASPALPQRGGGPPQWRQRTSGRRPRPAGLRWRREALHSSDAWGEKGRHRRRLGREGTTASREGRGSRRRRRRRLQLGFAVVCGVWCGSGVWCALWCAVSVWVVARGVWCAWCMVLC